MHLVFALLSVTVLLDDTISEQERALLANAQTVARKSLGMKLHTSFITRVIQFRNDVEEARYTRTYRRRGDLYLIARDVEFDASKTEAVYCYARNPRYYFALEKRVGAKQWSVVDVVAPAPTIEASAERIPRPDVRDQILLPPKAPTREIMPFMPVHSVNELPLLPNLKVTSVSMESGGILKVCYTFTHDELFLKHDDLYYRRKDLPATAVIYADKSQNYMTRHWQMQCRGDDLEVEKTATFEFTQVENRDVWREMVTQKKTKFKGITTTERIVSEMLEISWEDPPEEKFYLSAFGLPEPYGIEWERPTPWWLYSGIAAGVLLVVIFLLGLWKRRLLARG